MYFLSNLCFLCLGICKNLKPVLTENNKGILIKKKLKYCFPEINVNSHSEISKYVCNSCMNNLERLYKFMCNNCVSNVEPLYKFKQTCLRKNIYLKSYLQSLTSTPKTHKYLSVKLTDIKYQNKLQTVSSCQTLPIVENDKELRIGEKEDSSYIKKKGAAFKSKIECDDVLGTEDLQSLLEEGNEIEECITFEDNAADESNCVKFKSIPSDFDVSVSRIDVIVQEESKYSNSSENSFHNLEENKITVGNNENTKKPFQCSVCSKGYSCRNGLVHHLQVHAGITNFKCSICNKRFIEKYDLSQHELIHTGIRNFECTICKKKFLTKHTLNKHERIHRIKNFECSMCKKKFLTKKALHSHEEIHSVIKKYECSICKKRFRQKQAWIRHIKNSHGYY